MQAVPEVSFALVSGSASWGIEFPEDLAEPGVRVLEAGLAFATPWGESGGWKLLEIDAAHSGDGRTRRILNVISHGWPDDRIDRGTHRRVAWVLQQAGVRKIVASSTAGSLNRALWARDFVIASDIIELQQTQYSLLPGRLDHMCSARQMICPALAGIVERTARELWPAGARVYGQASGLVAGHSWGPRFQTPAEVLAYRSLGADFTNHTIAPEATAAREIGACFVNCTYITASFGDYFLPVEQAMALENVHEALIPEGSRVSLRAVARAVLDDSCGCARQRSPWPPKYRRRPA